MIRRTACSIVEFLESTYFTQRNVGKGQSGHLLDTARMIGRYLERDAVVSDLTTETINGFLRSTEEGKSPSTMASRRGHVLAIAHSAADHGLIDRVSARLIRRYRRNAPLPESWSPQEVARLIAAARRLTGEHRDVPRAAWWEAYIRTAYDTGLRPVDLHRITQSHFDSYGVLAIDQNKTGVMVVRRVRPSTMKAIKAVKRSPLFGGYLGKDQRSEWFRKIVTAAGLSGTFYRLRSTCGTLVENEQPGKGHVALGNGRAVFERHYYAKRINRESIPMPPMID
jgi:integrase